VGVEHIEQVLTVVNGQTAKNPVQTISTHPRDLIVLIPVLDFARVRNDVIVRFIVGTDRNRRATCDVENPHVVIVRQTQPPGKTDLFFDDEDPDRGAEGPRRPVQVQQKGPTPSGLGI
jgi:hypothetical protein